MNVIFFMCGHDCRVNAVTPCHIGPGGLIGRFEDINDPCLKPCLQQAVIRQAGCWSHCGSTIGFSSVQLKLL